MSAPLDVLLLGEIALSRLGARLALPASRKTRALFGYLATTQRPQPRSRLCGLFWEGTVDPRGELRWSLSRLRSSVGDGVLAADADSVAIVEGALSTDLQGLESIDPAVADLNAAERFFCGEFLSGLDLPDCFAFQAWLCGERERIAALRSGLLSRWASLDGNPRSSLSAARLWMAHDPHAESAHAAVVRALRRLGRSREAASQHAASRAFLLRELGAVSSDLAGALGEPTQDERVSWPGGGARATLAAAIPFVGRQELLTEAAKHLADPESRRRLLLVRGEPGMGKSRFLAELGSRLGPDGREGGVAAARAFEAATGRPYALWADLLAEGWSAAVERSAGDREALFTRVAETLAARAVPCHLAIILDDLQWADEASIALLHQLIGASNERLRFVGAMRLGEPDREAPIGRLLRDLGREGRLRTLELQLLEPTDTERLVRSVDSSLDAAAIARTAAGHPLYALELARAPGADLPATLAVLVGERLSRLSADARSLVTWAAAWGTRIEADRLEELSQLSPREFLSAWEECEQGRILTSSGEGRVDLTHDLVRRVAYEQIPPARRTWLHRQIAQALAAGAWRDPPARARHAALAGEPRDAAEAQLEAADAALRLAAPDAVLGFVERGLGFTARLDEDQALGLRLDLLRTLIHARRGRPERVGIAEEVRRLVERARALGRHRETQVGLYLAAVLDEERGDLSGAERRVLQAAEAARSADPATAARALANTGRCLAQIERDPERAEGLLLEARDLEARAGVALLDVPWGLALVAHAAGREDEARAEFATALERAAAIGDAWAESQCLLRLAALEIDAGDDQRALACLARLAALAEKLGEGSEAASARALSALIRNQDSLEEALEDLRRVDAKGVLAFVLNEAARRDLEAGNPERARRRAGEALDSASAVGRRAQIERAQRLLDRLPATPSTSVPTPVGDTETVNPRSDS